MAKKCARTFSIVVEKGKKSILDVGHLLPDALPRSVRDMSRTRGPRRENKQFLRAYQANFALLVRAQGQPARVADVTTSSGSSSARAVSFGTCGSVQKSSRYRSRRELSGNEPLIFCVPVS